MKIDNDKQMVLLKGLSKPATPKADGDVGGSAVKVGASGDKVELSGWKDEVARLTAQVKALPDVDEAKVASVKRAIESGTYNAKGELVARSMLKSQLLDETL